MIRAGNRVRTDDLLITNQLLYQLSYAGFSDLDHSRIIPTGKRISKFRSIGPQRDHRQNALHAIQRIPEICHRVSR
jgi:hypothetical protein